MALRSLIDGILQSTANDMRKQKECVDIAMMKRIDETRDAKQKLEDHLSKVCRIDNPNSLTQLWIYSLKIT